MENQTLPPPPSGLSKAFNTAIKIFTVPATAITGWFAGDVWIRGALYKKFAKQGFFDGRRRNPINDTYSPQGDYDQTLHQYVRDKYEHKLVGATTDPERKRLATNAVKFHVFDKQEMEGVLERLHLPPIPIEIAPMAIKDGLEKSDFKGRLRNLIKAYRGEIREFFSDLDMTNIFDYTKGIAHNQKVEALVFAATTAAITLGALVAVQKSQAVEEKLDRLSRRQESQENTRSL